MTLRPVEEAAMEPHQAQPPPTSQDRRDRPGVPPRPLGACEACRAVKLKCLPGPGPGGGACRRCSDYKRECVYRTGPRTRISRAARMNRENPTPRPSQQTFSIDFQMPADDRPDAAFDGLVQDHAGYFESLLPEEPSLNPLSGSTPPPSSVSSAGPGQTRTVQSLCLQPQFNLESASSLLDEFRQVLPYFPCIFLGDDETVASLAKGRPFVLLAILAAVSGSRTVQGHALYDEEFRNVLALKVVAGGERSLELAQGLLIYCGWFPFHLRPKNKRVYQYLRMLVDIVRDLELNHSPSDSNTAADVTPDRVDGVRTYLGCYYLLTAFTSFWPKLNKTHDQMRYTPWTSTCWSTLPTVSPHPQDLVLAQLARHAYIIQEASDANRKRRDDGDQLRLVMLGLEAQLRDWETQIPAHITQLRPVQLGALFTQIFVYCVPLLKFPAPDELTNTLAPDLKRVLLAVPLLRRYYEEVKSVDLRGFSASDWGRIILCAILGMRLSFPIKGFYDWNYAGARTELGFAEFLDAVSCGAEEQTVDEGSHTTGMVDIRRASGVIFGVVRKKYNGRLERERVLKDATRSTCPMLDGSLDRYLGSWDDNFGIVDPNNVSMDTSGTVFAPGTCRGSLGGQSVDAGHEELGQLVYHDLWATMTMAWAEGDTESSGPRS